MGMTIDEFEEYAKTHNILFMTKEFYETRLKADMVAMLEELDLTIDEIPIVTRHGMTETIITTEGMRKKIKENIQQKINALKEVEDGKYNT